MGELFIAFARTSPSGVRGIDAVHIGGFENGVATHFGRPSTAVVSVVKNGLPVPPANTTTRLSSRCRIARARS